MRVKSYFRQENNGFPVEENFVAANFRFAGDPVTVDFGMHMSSALELINYWNNLYPEIKFWVAK